MTENEIVKRFREIRPDYLPSPAEDRLWIEDERAEAVKRIINTRLNMVDRTIILLYADCGSQRKLGKMLGVSRQTANKEVARIRALIMEELNKERKL